MLGVARGSLYYKEKEEITSMKRYKRNDDEWILDWIKYFQEQRPTYGYKRITAMINNSKVADYKINKKRIYRIMDMNNLLIRRPITAKTKREHNGKIITLHSNTRWCSDVCEIKCFNGERVFVSFILDCCDREAIAYIVKTSHFVAQDIQAMQLDAVMKRYQEVPLGREIQFLTDRGSIYRDKKTVANARSLGLKSCFTLPYSPESDGMSEAFVNTLKRDYVYVNDCVSADVVLKMIPNWFKDYNENAPHSGLGMLSPVEYKKLNINKIAV